MANYWKIALWLNSIEILMGVMFILTALRLIPPMPPLSPMPWLYTMVEANEDTVAAVLCLYGGGLGCMGLSGTFALATGEQPSRHSVLMYGLYHWNIAIVCGCFRNLAGFFPGGLLFHMLIGTLFLASFPASNKDKAR